MSRSEYELEFASNRMMLAWGAMEWAHSTSRASSTSQRAVAGVGWEARCPVSLRTLSVGPPVTLNCCRPNSAAEAAGVGDDVGIVVGIDDGDGLSRAGARRAAERNLVHSIGGPHLGRVDGSHTPARIGRSRRGAVAQHDKSGTGRRRQQQPLLEAPPPGRPSMRRTAVLPTLRGPVRGLLFALRLPTLPSKNPVSSRQRWKSDIRRTPG